MIREGRRETEEENSERWTIKFGYDFCNSMHFSESGQVIINCNRCSYFKKRRMKRNELVETVLDEKSNHAISLNGILLKNTRKTVNKRIEIYVWENLCKICARLEREFHVGRSHHDSVYSFGDIDAFCSGVEGCFWKMEIIV